jgi:hypothetical protein
MKAFLRTAVALLSLLIAAAWISGCVIHAHHVDDDGSKPAKTHKAKPVKKHEAKPPAEAEPEPAEPADEDEVPTRIRHNPPTPPPPTNEL